MSWLHRAEYARTHPNDPRPPLGKEYDAWLIRADAWMPRRRTVDGCETCQTITSPHSPSHDASEWCESGKRTHCTCDRCF